MSTPPHNLNAYQPLPIAADSTEELTIEAHQLAARLMRDPNTAIAELAARRLREQPAGPARRVVFARNRDEAIQLLREPPGPSAVVGDVAGENLTIGFIFSGPSKEKSLREIYELERPFREHFDRCSALSRGLGAGDLTAHLDDPPDVETPEGLRLLFALEYALFGQWLHWGIRPAAVIGYSFGELVAATTVGVFELRDGFALADARAQLLRTIEPGAMTSVGMSVEQVRPLLEGDMQIAIHRSARSCVVSGTPAEIEALESTLRLANIAFQRLDLRLAGHSRQAAKVAEAFATRVAAVTRHAPEIPLISNVHGRSVAAEEIVDPHYWGRQLAQTVQFASGLQSLVHLGCRVLIEIGPGHNLTALSSQQLQQEGVHVLSSLRSVMKLPSTHLSLLRALARLWTLGVAVDWHAVQTGSKA